MLLHLIEDTSSVRDACGYMGISHSAAWSMLNPAEDHRVIIEQQAADVDSSAAFCISMQYRIVDDDRKLVFCTKCAMKY